MVSTGSSRNLTSLTTMAQKRQTPDKAWHKNPLAFVETRSMDEKNLTDRLLKGLPFTNIFRTFRFAIQPGKLIVALFAIAAIYISGTLMDLSRTVVVAPGALPGDIACAPGSGIFWNNPPSELHASLSGHGSWLEFVTAYDEIAPPIGVFTALRHFCIARFDGFVLALARADLSAASANLHMLAGAIWWAARYHTLYAFAFSAVTLVVMAIAGGAICRSAALQLAKDERPGLMESLRFSTRRFTSLVGAPLWAIAIIAMTGAFIALLGLLGNIPFGVGPVALGLVSPLAILLGFVMTIFILAFFAGGSLMFPAVAYESSDSMDAMGRAFGYVCVRPWRMAFYALLTTFYGAACYLFIRFFAFILLLATRAFLAATVFVHGDRPSPADGRPVSLIDAIWPAPAFENLLGNWPESSSTAHSIGAVLVRLPNLLIAALIAAFLLSFFFCASTVIYAMLRKHVDGEDFGRISVEAATFTTDGIGT